MAKILLKDMNTNVIPVIDFGCTYGGLAYAANDVFNYSEFTDESDLDQEGMDPEDHAYAVRLIRERYDGWEEFEEAALDLAPAYINDAFESYAMSAKVISGSCKWHHPKQYNYGDDAIVFDMLVDAAWVEDTILKLIDQDSEFINFVIKYFHNSYTIDAIDDLYAYLNPRNSDYWRVVACLISYLVSEDEVISEDLTRDLVEELMESGSYVSYSSLGIYR